jgi:maltose-binding protein MalE
LLALDNESPHKEEAIELMKYLASREAQLNRFRETDQIPSIDAVVEQQVTQVTQE